MSIRFVQGTMVAALALCAAEASAQGFPEFGHQGTAALGAERLMGVTFASVKTETQSSDLTYISMLGNAGHATPYDMPKITFDYFVARTFSIGGGFVVATYAPETGDNTTLVALNPRLGAGIPLGDAAGVWFRGGITYYSTTAGDFDIHGVGFNLDAMFALSLAPSFAITVGPVADVGLSGTVKSPGGEGDQKLTGFGLNAGLAGFF